LLGADVVLGNLETTLTAAGAQQCGPKSRSCFSFRAPPSYARGLADAGFTVLNLANNHAFGRPGLLDTIAALKDAGVRQTGRPGQIAYIRVGETRVAVVGFAPYDWAQDLLDLDAARRLVRRAAKRADVVVVTMHAGAEGTRHAHVRPGMESFLGEARGDPVRFAHAVVGAGADLVVGHGPHVLRGIEWYRGRLIAYSLGNFASYRNFDVTGAGGVSAILYVTLRADGSWVAGRLVPIRLAGTGAPARDADGAALGVVRSLSREDFGRRAVRVSLDGDLRPPL
jgi:poly-gamma-glutamate capsule biosynthesis protein CapA/YwtB (metallophosphatase superfamily)